MKFLRQAILLAFAATLVLRPVCFHAQQRDRSALFAQEKQPVRSDEQSSTTKSELELDAGAELRRCKMPPPNEILAIVAEAYCHPFGFDDIASFEVPTERFAELLSFFDGVECDDNERWNWELSEIGTIRLKLKNGGTVRLCWYAVAAKVRLHFSYAGQRYVRFSDKELANDENLFVDGYVRGLYESQIKKQK